MHDTLAYFARDPVFRKFHHNELTFRPMYAGTENFVLPLSHDEVVHGKGSLLGKMPGAEWQKLANLRLLFAWMWAQPGKKLLFMGGEIGQWREWDHDSSLDWHLLEWPEHRGLQRWVGDLNRVLREEAALHEVDFDPHGFEWIDCADAGQSVVSFARFGRDRSRTVIVVLNATPVVRHGYRVGVTREGAWKELLNSDAQIYGGGGVGNMGGAWGEQVPWHGRPFSLDLTLPPLGMLVLAPR